MYDTPKRNYIVKLFTLYWKNPKKPVIHIHPYTKFNTILLIDALRENLIFEY